MTIASDDPRKAGPYDCNGVTVTFPFSFKIFAAATDLLVTLADSNGVETTLAYSTDYSVSMNADQNANPGGSITTVSTYATGYTVTVESDVPATQNTSIPSPSAFSPTVIEAALDRAVALVLDIRTKLDRTLRGPRSDDDVLIDLPVAAERANKFLSFDVTGQPTAASGTASVAVSAAMEPVVGAASLDTARSVMGTQLAGPSNITLTVSANAGALTIALKGYDGADHSTSNPGAVTVLDGGTADVLDITSAQTITIPSTATLGAIANVPFRVWVVGVSFNGAFRLGVINPLQVSAGFPHNADCTLYQLDAWGTTDQHVTISATSDSAGVISMAADGSGAQERPYTLLGYVEYIAGLATPGTWTAGTVRAWKPGMPTPGQVVHSYSVRSAAVATGTTVLPIDDTIPQSGEGVALMTATHGFSNLDMSSPCNLLSIEARAYLASSNTDVQMAGALFLNSDADACAAGVVAREGSAGFRTGLTLSYFGPNVDASGGQVSAVSMRGGTASAGTTTFNGSAGARTFGGRMASQIVCSEIMT